MNEIKSVLGHVNTDLLGYNAVLFVEGNSEFRTIPLLAGNLGIDVVNDGIRIVDSEGYGNMKQIKNIIDFLRDNETEVYALSDNHSSKHGRLNDIRNRLGNNYTELQKDFEDSFDTDTTLRTDLSSPTASAFAILRDKYQQKSPSKLSKVRLGERIANVLQGSQYAEKSEPEKLIRKIHDKVVKQMNLEL